MKALKSILATSLLLTLMNCQSQDDTNSTSMSSIYDIQINTLMGEALDLSQFKGKKMLIVNVASECGFTPQYEDLQKLHAEHGDKIVVIGVPCNQFGGQEPGNAEEIQKFCSVNYGVEFVMTEKVDVKGDDQHPLYAWLTNKDNNGVKSSEVRWNFQKYLIDENGKYIDFYYSMTNPMSDKILGKL